MKVSEALERCADILEERGAWIQHSTALNRRGEEADPCSGLAARWCAIGAINRVCGRDPTTDVNKGCVAAMREVIGKRAKWVQHWNDAPSRTQEEVVEAFRTAAKRTFGGEQ